MLSFLWPGTQLLFRHEWTKLTGASPLLHCIDGYSHLSYWNESLLSVFQVLDENFLVLHFYGNVCIWIPKVIWPRLGSFWSFMLEYDSFSRLHICMDWDLQELFKFCFFFCWHQFFSVVSFRCILLCSRYVPVFFSQRLFWYRLMGSAQPSKFTC